MKNNNVICDRIVRFDVTRSDGSIYQVDVDKVRDIERLYDKIMEDKTVVDIKMITYINC